MAPIEEQRLPPAGRKNIPLYDLATRRTGVFGLHWRYMDNIIYAEPAVLVGAADRGKRLAALSLRDAYVPHIFRHIDAIKRLIGLLYMVSFLHHMPAP